MPYTSTPFAARAIASQGMCMPAFSLVMGMDMITTITTITTAAT